MAQRKVLLVNKFYHDKGPAGGVGRYLVQEEEDLLAAGWDVIPFAMADAHARPSPWERYFVRARDYSTARYGGGAMQEWVSDDDGKTWRMAGALDPEPGLIYNNPSPAWTSDGKPLDDWLVFYGWNGPRSIDDYIQDDRDAFHNSGKAFLWHDGSFK